MSPGRCIWALSVHRSRLALPLFLQTHKREAFPLPLQRKWNICFGRRDAASNLRCRKVRPSCDEFFDLHDSCRCARCWCKDRLLWFAQQCHNVAFVFFILLKWQKLWASFGQVQNTWVIFQPHPKIMGLFWSFEMFRLQWIGIDKKLTCEFLDPGTYLWSHISGHARLKLRWKQPANCSSLIPWARPWNLRKNPKTSWPKALAIFLLRAPFGQYGPVAALYWALVCVPRHDSRPGPGGSRTAASCQRQAWRPSAIPLHHSAGYSSQNIGEANILRTWALSISRCLCSRSIAWTSSPTDARAAGHRWLRKGSSIEPPHGYGENSASLLVDPDSPSHSGLTIDDSEWSFAPKYFEAFENDNILWCLTIVVSKCSQRIGHFWPFWLVFKVNKTQVIRFSLFLYSGPRPPSEWRCEIWRIFFARRPLVHVTWSCSFIDRRCENENLYMALELGRCPFCKWNRWKVMELTTWAWTGSW